MNTLVYQLTFRIVSNKNENENTRKLEGGNFSYPAWKNWINQPHEKVKRNIDSFQYLLGGGSVMIEEIDDTNVHHLSINIS